MQVRIFGCEEYVEKCVRDSGKMIELRAGDAAAG